MRCFTIPVLAAALACGVAAGQEQLWQVPSKGPSSVQYHWVSPFPDYDGDGFRDMLQRTTPIGGSPSILQVVSGRDGSSLWRHVASSVIKLFFAGDVNRDGHPDYVTLNNYGGWRAIEAHSLSQDTALWRAWMPTGSGGHEYGKPILANIDINGDSAGDVLVATSHSAHSTMWAYNSDGTLLYSTDLLAQGLIAKSFCNMGDMNGDGCDDYVIGCLEFSARGALILTSGIDGSFIRISYGPVVGDYLSEHATNLGDIDGDGVNDYMGFPSLFTFTGIAYQFSGATGALIRQMPTLTNSVIANEDVDRDGIRDLILGTSYWGISAPGRVTAFSGRDGTELWRYGNTAAIPGAGYTNGSWGFALHSAGLGVPPGQHYPTIAWLDPDYAHQTNPRGRVRAFSTAHLGLGDITGHPCSSSEQFPQIGGRQTSNGARITIANAMPGAFAYLNLSLSPQNTFAGVPLPTSLAPYGMPGCQLLVAPEVTYWRQVGVTGIDRGYAAVDLPFDLATATTGTAAAAQWLVFDSGTLDFQATARHELYGQ